MIYADLGARIVAYLRQRPLPPVAVEFRRSTRGVGDAIEQAIVTGFGEIVQGLVDTYRAEFSRRALEDVSFEVGGMYYAMDIKTRRASTEFNMPNLISVRRLMDFYRESTHFFVVTMVEYDLLAEGLLSITDVIVEPIEWFRWSCLGIGALGWGQIQLKEASRIEVDRTQTRQSWLYEFVERLQNHYAREKAKVDERLRYVEDFATHVLG